MRQQWSVLRVPAYQRYAASRAASGTASTMLQAVVAWQVYTLTGSALDIGLVYAFVFALGIAAAFENPARQVLLPATVPRNLFSRAIVVNSTLQSFASVTGPALGGVLIAWQGIPFAYAVHGSLMAIAIVTLLRLRVAPWKGKGRAGVHLGAIREGLAFVWSRPVMLGAMTLDMFAVIFGGAKALLPIYAVDILHTDASGYGVLSASPPCCLAHRRPWRSRFSLTAPWARPIR